MIVMLVLTIVVGQTGCTFRKTVVKNADKKHASFVANGKRAEGENNQIVKVVFDRILEAAKRSDKYSTVANEYKWQIDVVDDPDTANAESFPSGKVIFWTGTCRKIIRNDAALAAVLGHE